MYRVNPRIIWKRGENWQRRRSNKSLLADNRWIKSMLVAHVAVGVLESFGREQLSDINKVSNPEWFQH
jgi:hypothetical protein